MSSATLNPDPTFEVGLHWLYRMLEEEREEASKPVPRFRFARFNALFLGQLIPLSLVVYGLLWVTGGRELVAANLVPAWGVLVLTLITAIASVGLGEYLLHLHPMHRGLRFGNKWNIGLIDKLNKWMSSIRHSHNNLHHGATDVTLTAKGLTDNYAIMTADQTVSATFPKASLALFWAAFAPLVAIAQYLWQQLPIVLASMIAISQAVWLYEHIHAVHHFPAYWWRKQCCRPYVGWIFRRLHALHFIHHLFPRRNLTVSGFLLIPVWDLIACSYRYPAELMEAWLENNPNTNWEEIWRLTYNDLQRKPWAFQIRATILGSTS